MASASAAIEQRNQDATLWVGGLEERVDDDLVWELFTQAGPLVSVHMPTDKVSGRHGGYAFVEFRTEQDAEYAMKVMQSVKVFGKSLSCRKAGENKNQRVEVGANLFVGNLAPEVDETMLYSTFGAFGSVAEVRVMRDPDSAESKGFGFVNFDAFEASDAAIEAMNGQYLAGRPIVVQYALRKDAKGERHGSQAERMLAAAMRGSSGVARPHTLFASAPGQAISTAATSAPMLGQHDLNAPPPMLPPTAILPQSMLPPPMPGQPGGGAGGAAMGMSMGMGGMGMQMPPPVPGAGPGGYPGPGMMMPPPGYPGMPPGMGPMGGGMGMGMGMSMGPGQHYGMPPPHMMPPPGSGGMMMPPPVPASYGMAGGPGRPY